LSDVVGADTAPDHRHHHHQHDRKAAERLVIELATRHAESLLRVARRYSYCADDAHDAYQRTMEILVRHAHRLDAKRAGGWLHTVVKHEALAVRAQRQRHVGGEDVDLDRLENRTAASPEERVIGLDQVGRAAEALRRLKPQEAQAMWLKAAGNSYAEICERTGWTYTKVNRCLAEGRRSFLQRYAGIESGEECRRWAPVLSAIVDGEADAEQVVQARVHIRNCASCRATLRQLHLAEGALALLVPAAGFAAVDAPGGSAEVSAGALSRLWEWAVSAVHGRAAHAAVRVQSAVDVATGHKVAAVAASAAALAGGGVAVERATQAPPVPASVAPATPGAAGATDHGAVGGGRAVAVALPERPAVQAPPVGTQQAQPSVSAGAGAAGVAGDRSPRADRREPGSASASASPSPSAAASSEPLVDPVESRPASAGPSPARTATTSAPAAASTPARPPAPSSSGGRSGGGSGAGSGSGSEFGFEG
jgi:RNA polymerase sigma factor (sigma-70 family)